MEKKGPIKLTEELLNEISGGALPPYPNPTETPCIDCGTTTPRHSTFTAPWGTTFYFKCPKCGREYAYFEPAEKYK